MSDISAWDTPKATSSPRAPTNEVMVLRVKAAIAKMIAATNNVLGRAITKIPARCAGQLTGPQRSASTQGIYFANRIPSETPRQGITEIKADARYRAKRKSILRSGVENRI